MAPLTVVEDIHVLRDLPSGLFPRFIAPVKISHLSCLSLAWTTKGTTNELLPAVGRGRYADSQADTTRLLGVRVISFTFDDTWETPSYRQLADFSFLPEQYKVMRGGLKNERGGIHF